MKKKIQLFLFLLLAAQSYSQARITQIITKQNDTITDVILKNKYTFKNELFMNLQEKLIVVNMHGVKKEYLPNELYSFTLTYDNESFVYESIDDKLFGQLIYSDQLRLLKVNTRNFFIFIFKRPKNGKTSYMEAKGLSRLISQNVISREMADCPDILKKVDDKTLKIHGVEGVIELIKYYEANCLK
ncbi:hypothetical protein [Flavobacterium sp.]|uniref:hypothetical protein n=1 Tax=Flavobacterium sp. TaxID=239 RepID=UPI002487B3AF|nr:hypothetical protein [Flavobacterium sp.]MDI1315891.1 hypothetical protein [Flavobacterium sp.]